VVPLLAFGWASARVLRVPSLRSSEGVRPTLRRTQGTGAARQRACGMRWIAVRTVDVRHGSASEDGPAGHRVAAHGGRSHRARGCLTGELDPVPHEHGPALTG
jgi:hypothetical protein